MSKIEQTMISYNKLLPDCKEILNAVVNNIEDSYKKKFRNNKSLLNLGIDNLDLIGFFILSRSQKLTNFFFFRRFYLLQPTF